MSIVTVIVYLIVIGVLMYVVNSVVPLPQWMRTIINALVSLLVMIWLLQVFGLISRGSFGLRIR